MSMRSATKYQSPSPAKQSYSPSKMSTKASGLGVNNGSMMKSSTAKGMRSTTEFSKHLRTLQQSADENIEDEYIKNLQQQIAYQELELKLLKEKELEQKQSVSQIDKFFNDGVPLNENILALKNQYNHIKKTLENRIDELNDKKLIEMKIAVDLKNQYERNSANLKTIHEALDKKEKDYMVQMAELRMAYLNEKHRREENDKEFRRLQSLLKEKNTDNLSMTRDQERAALLVHHKAEGLKQKRQKTIDDLKSKDQWMVSLQDEVEKKRSQATHNPEINLLDAENKDLDAKIGICGRDISLAEAKVKEMDMYMQTRAREREHEAEMKRDLLAQISKMKIWIDEQHTINEMAIAKKVKEKEDKEKRDLDREIHEVKNLKTMTKQRQEQKEDHIKEMTQEKMGVQQDIIALELENNDIEKEIKEKKEFLVKLRNSKEALTQELKDLEDKLQPFIHENGKMAEQIPIYKADNDKLKDQIAHLETMNELSVQLKNVNLEELKLLTQSNDQVQTTILDLMRKWDLLQRAGSLGKVGQHA